MKKLMKQVGTVIFGGVEIPIYGYILETEQEFRECEANEKVVEAAEKIVEEFLNK